jgi:hypothetical protein
MMTGFGTFFAARIPVGDGLTWALAEVVGPAAAAEAPDVALGSPADAEAVADGEAVADTGVAEISPESLP